MNNKYLKKYTISLKEIARELTNLQRIMNALVFVVVFPSEKFVGIAIGQAAVEPNVLLIFWEAPKCNKKL